MELNVADLTDPTNPTCRAVAWQFACGYQLTGMPQPIGDDHLPDTSNAKVSTKVFNEECPDCRKVTYTWLIRRRSLETENVNKGAHACHARDKLPTTDDAVTNEVPVKASSKTRLGGRRSSISRPRPLAPVRKGSQSRTTTPVNVAPRPPRKTSSGSISPKCRKRSTNGVMFPANDTSTSQSSSPKNHASEEGDMLLIDEISRPEMTPWGHTPSTPQIMPPGDDAFLSKKKPSINGCLKFGKTSCVTGSQAASLPQTSPTNAQKVSAPHKRFQSPTMSSINKASNSRNTRSASRSPQRRISSLGSISPWTLPPSGTNRCSPTQAGSLANKPSRSQDRSSEVPKLEAPVVLSPNVSATRSSRSQTPSPTSKCYEVVSPSSAGSSHDYIASEVAEARRGKAPENSDSRSRISRQAEKIPRPTFTVPFTDGASAQEQVLEALGDIDILGTAENLEFIMGHVALVSKTCRKERTFEHILRTSKNSLIRRFTGNASIGNSGDEAMTRTITTAHFIAGAELLLALKESVDGASLESVRSLRLLESIETTWHDFLIWIILIGKMRESRILKAQGPEVYAQANFNKASKLMFAFCRGVDIGNERWQEDSLMADFVPVDILNNEMVVGEKLRRILTA